MVLIGRMARENPTWALPKSTASYSNSASCFRNDPCLDTCGRWSGTEIDSGSTGEPDSVLATYRITGHWKHGNVDQVTGQYCVLLLNRDLAQSREATIVLRLCCRLLRY